MKNAVETGPTTTPESLHTRAMVDTCRSDPEQSTAGGLPSDFMDRVPSPEMNLTTQVS